MLLHALGIAVGALGVFVLVYGVVQRLLRRPAAGSGIAKPVPLETLSPRNPPPASGLSSISLAGSLKDLRARVDSGSVSLPAELHDGVRGRLQEVIDALAAAAAVLNAGPPDALDVAAERLAFCHGVTGIAWRSYLAGSGEAHRLIGPMAAALSQDARPLMVEVARLLAARPGPVLSRRDGAYALPCAACGADAVSFTVTDDGIVRYDRLSPVNPGAEQAGEDGKRLATLLAEGDGREIVELLSTPTRAGLDQYCGDCGRVYCRRHFAVETEWSGSWHAATHATCPLGHAREIE